MPGIRIGRRKHYTAPLIAGFETRDTGTQSSVVRGSHRVASSRTLRIDFGMRSTEVARLAGSDALPFVTG